MSTHARIYLLHHPDSKLAARLMKWHAKSKNDLVEAENRTLLATPNTRRSRVPRVAGAEPSISLKVIHRHPPSS